MTHVLHVRTVVCKKCRKAHTTSELYIIADLRPGYRHLIRATEPPSYQPELVTLPHEQIDACHECVMQLPTNPTPRPHWIPLGWRERERVATAKPSLTSNLPTSDDLI